MEKCKSDIQVTVYCMAYNHGAVIRKCLEGFVNQETTFNFEVIIHDDASTDDTAKIIREYAQRFPQIFKPIFQTENQYSKGVKIYREFIYPRIQGKYLAVCEGDDYWIDSHKLQKQYECMVNHPEISLCIHDAYIMHLDTGEMSSTKHTVAKKRYLSSEEIIVYGGGYYPTCSFFYKTDLNSSFSNIEKGSTTGDYKILLAAMLDGKVYYLPEKLAVRNVGLSTSWSSTNMGSYDKYLQHVNATIEWICGFDTLTEGKFSEFIKIKKLMYEFSLQKIAGNYKILFTKEYRKLMKYMTKREILSYFGRSYLSLLWNSYRKLKK